MLAGSATDGAEDDGSAPLGQPRDAGLAVAVSVSLGMGELDERTAAGLAVAVSVSLGMGELDERTAAEQPAIRTTDSRSTVVFPVERTSMRPTYAELGQPRVTEATSSESIPRHLKGRRAYATINQTLTVKPVVEP